MASGDAMPAPLAEYFWVAGMDSNSYWSSQPPKSLPGNQVPVRGSLITEDLPEAREPEDQVYPARDDSLTFRPSPLDKRSSDRIEQISSGIQETILEDGIKTPSSLEAGGFADTLGSRMSTLSTNSASPSFADTKRSSQSSNATIIASTANGQPRPTNTTFGDNLPHPAGFGIGDFDFDTALRKFATERENFLEDLSFSAGAVQHQPKKPPPVNARIQKVMEGTSGTPSLAKSGSLRRRISLRDLNSMRRAPSVVNRAASIRTSKRLSNYNSVIQVPEPLAMDPKMHPLKRKFEPVLLDRYPPKSNESTELRIPFPDFVPMQCMTGGDNSRLYGVCVLIWIPLNQRAAEDVERQCEEWRRDNMSPEERELASSLGERLASERAKLSRLLAKLPSVVSDPRARETLDDEINATEEKIGLMADLLRPVRHGAASKIEGLTDGENGLWIPRSYGILGKDPALTSFYKEWLKAIVVPMVDGWISRVPPPSPKVGMWQPLERYVVNLCDEAMMPVTSKTQIELAIRELHLYARKEALNEIPGSRNVDLYPLFRSLSLENIITLFEAPCPYIVGVEKRYEKLEFPEDGCVVCDLDENSILSYAEPMRLPKQQRRKLMSLLQLAAPHHNRFGVEIGPPAYALETFPYDTFAAENPSIFSSNPVPSSLAKLVSLPSNSFGDIAVPSSAYRPPLFNVFLQARGLSRTQDLRPTTSGTLKGGNPPSPNSPRSILGSSSSRADSGNTLTATLRGKRSGNFENLAQRRSSSFGVDRQVPNLRRPSVPFTNHSPSPSTSSLVETGSTYNQYPPSVYTPSTLAASTIIPQMLVQPVRDTATTKWVEGHCLQWQTTDFDSTCSLCEEKSDEGLYHCTACNVITHNRCSGMIFLPCPAAFHPEQVRAAFLRCFASLLYTYRRFMQPSSGDPKKGGKIYKFNIDGFIKSLPNDAAEYVTFLNETQAFNEFIEERESLRADDPKAMLFEQVIMSKKNRGRSNFFGKAKDISYLNDASEHLWRTCSVAVPLSSRVTGEPKVLLNRTPAKLDPGLMKEPRMQYGAPKVKSGKPTRKPIPSGPRFDELQSKR
ncbi:hypothetical protein H072_10878 [Dactylellina haptotyla CBS 200.50]|uniref:Phorbol-ester/DAG-type domain-containing protein n=1 Tax=Dactylellina haptotyla (strain CBS 200.50) TaxID=1284197 RepID=S7ZY53_DACHA|nr:hypothetical protein H072_10878 [Dactylellina haptotyla CBS 200.50]